MTPPRLALVAAMFAAMVTGCNYGFAMYSSALKEQFSLTQGQLDNINTIPYAFGVTSPFWGKVSQRMGPRRAILVGGYIVTIMQASGHNCTQIPQCP